MTTVLLEPIANFDAASASASAGQRYIVQEGDGSTAIASYDDGGWADQDTEDELHPVAFAGPIELCVAPETEQPVADEAVEGGGEEPEAA